MFLTAITMFIAHIQFSTVEFPLYLKIKSREIGKSVAKYVADISIRSHGRP